ncbi:MAG: hypothetical protein B7Z55_03395 [Planctomycetales bacterium 12-60-4]|nr:MAG: hypothetical protein B7Z55_03395 [Planctomycetales bacterium 12-60-4]
MVLMQARHSRRSPSPSTVVVPRTCAAVLLMVALAVPGCAGLNGFAFRKDHGPFGPRTPCALSKTPTVEEVVQHVNQNVDKIQGWRASSVKIRAQSVPIPLEGLLYVERDKRLRLEVSAFNKELDLGSNDELFWLWMKPRGQQPPAIFYARHENMDVARQHLPIPFDPSWLMEALGVTRLSTENVQMEGEPGVAAIRLVSSHTMPDGVEVKKVVVVNACHGYVMEHSTYDRDGRPLVRALLQDYRRDQASGAVLPHYVKLDWPQAEMSLAMNLGHVEVNPPAIPAGVWEMPQIPQTPLVDLGDPRLGGPQYAARRRSEPEMSTPPGRSQTRGSKPTVIATTSEELDPAFLPPMSAYNQEPENFVPPAREADEFEFEPPMEDGAPGRARLGDSLPETVPF